MGTSAEASHFTPAAWAESATRRCPLVPTATREMAPLPVAARMSPFAVTTDRSRYWVWGSPTVRFVSELWSWL